LPYPKALRSVYKAASSSLLDKEIDLIASGRAEEFVLKT